MRNESNLLSELDSEISDELLAILHGFPNEYAIKNVEMLDGFFTALLCCPHIELPIESIYAIFGNENKDDISPFDDIEQYEYFFSLLMIYWCSVVLRLQDDTFKPFLEDTGEDCGKFWSGGFLRGLLIGLEISGETLANIVNDKKNGVMFFPILALAYNESCARPELDFLREKMTPDLRKELIETLPEIVFAIREFFENRWNPMPVTKIGRNAPCPCGSGKKYKKCCLREVLH